MTARHAESSRRARGRPRSLERELSAALSGRARAEDPPLGLPDRDVVDTRLPAAHQAMLVELPLLVAVAAPPPALRVMGLVLEPDRDPVLAERPQVLAQGIVELAVPLGGEELDDRGPPGEESVAVAPGRFDGVRARGRGYSRRPRRPAPWSGRFPGRTAVAADGRSCTDSLASLTKNF